MWVIEATPEKSKEHPNLRILPFPKKMVGCSVDFKVRRRNTQTGVPEKQHASCRRARRQHPVLGMGHMQARDVVCARVPACSVTRIAHIHTRWRRPGLDRTWDTAWQTRLQRITGCTAHTHSRIWNARDGQNQPANEAGSAGPQHAGRRFEDRCATG